MLSIWSKRAGLAPAFSVWNTDILAFKSPLHIFTLIFIISMEALMKIIFFVLLICNISYSYPTHPEKELSPGNLCATSDSDFQEYRYKEQIPYCARNVSKKTKNWLYDHYNIPEEDKSEYTIDHIIPLSIGGSNSIKNLWPQNKEIYTGKYEFDLYNKLKDGEITQEEAIDSILKLKFH